MSEENEKIRELIFSRISDCVLDLMYYDTKEDEELPKGAIEKCVQDGIISYEEMAKKFKDELTDS